MDDPQSSLDDQSQASIVPLQSAQSQTQISPKPSTKSTSKWPIISLIAIITLAVAGAVAVAAFYQINSQPKVIPSAPTPTPNSQQTTTSASQTAALPQGWTYQGPDTNSCQVSLAIPPVINQREGGWSYEGKSNIFTPGIEYKGLGLVATASVSYKLSDSSQGTSIRVICSSPLVDSLSLDQLAQIYTKSWQEAPVGVWRDGATFNPQPNKITNQHSFKLGNQQAISLTQTSYNSDTDSYITEDVYVVAANQRNYVIQLKQIDGQPQDSTIGQTIFSAIKF